jgi:hypothetical protein
MKAQLSVPKCRTTFCIAEHTSEGLHKAPIQHGIHLPGGRRAKIRYAAARAPNSPGIGNPNARNLNSTANVSNLSTRLAFSNWLTAPSTCRTRTAVGVSVVKKSGADV